MKCKIRYAVVAFAIAPIIGACASNVDSDLERRDPERLGGLGQPLERLVLSETPPESPAPSPVFSQAARTRELAAPGSSPQEPAQRVSQLTVTPSNAVPIAIFDPCVSDQPTPSPATYTACWCNDGRPDGPDSPHHCCELGQTWDAACVAAASWLCGGVDCVASAAQFVVCPPATSLPVNSGPQTACSPSFEAVCAADPFCCNQQSGAWDQLCAAAAAAVEKAFEMCGG